MTGPATNAATIATVWKIMGRRIAIIYLFAVAASALAAGLVLDGFFRTGGSYAMSHSHWMMPRWIAVVCALALIGVLGYAFRRPAKVGESAPAGERVMIVRFTIQGMTCNHCALAVQRALAESPGVLSAEVDLKKGEATASGAELDAAQLARAIESLGYKVVDTDQRVGST
jgi:copper chaperone CopZ